MKAQIPPHVPQLPQLLTEHQLAKELKISPRHLGTLRAQRLIPHLKLGRLVRYNISQVASALDQLTVRAGRVGQ